MSLQFTGRITEIQEPRTGTTEKGEWANVEFEVTESNPQNADYPQIGKFDFFKNGEHVKYARDFKNYYSLGDEITVEFNLKRNEYTKHDGTPARFYKTSAWKINKVSGAQNNPPVPPVEAFETTTNVNSDDPDDLPF